MDCLVAQAAISEALDGATSDAEVLAAAREHCQECDACMSFVHALTVVKRAPLPDPPADLADRVMAAVRAEAAAAEPSGGTARAAATATVGVAVAASASASVGVGVGVEGDSVQTRVSAPSTPIPVSTRLKQTRPSVLVAWASAAALLLVGVGVASVMGIRMMATPLATTTATLGSTPRKSANGDLSQPQAAESGAPSVAAAAPTSGFIVFNGSVYELVGPSTVQTSRFSQMGITKSSLDGNDTRDRQVMGTSGVANVYVLNDQGKLLEFKPVTRKYSGQTYQLKSGDVPTFGDWPALPADIAEPTSEDGSPTFTAVGADSNGVTIYRLAASTAPKGVALAPNAPEGDPAAGNPNWTWWVPAQ
jgi:hypothetical protein